MGSLCGIGVFRQTALQILRLVRDFSVRPQGLETSKSLVSTSPQSTRAIARSIRRRRDHPSQQFTPNESVGLGDPGGTRQTAGGHKRE